MLQHVLVDDVPCPRCASPLVSFDAAAADDVTTRIRLRREGQRHRFSAYVTALGLAHFGLVTVVDVWFGGWRSLDRWSLAEATIGYACMLALTVGTTRAWLRLRQRRQGRLATCHACGHHFTLP